MKPVLSSLDYRRCAEHTDMDTLGVGLDISWSPVKCMTRFGGCVKTYLQKFERSSLPGTQPVHQLPLISA